MLHSQVYFFKSVLNRSMVKKNNLKGFLLSLFCFIVTMFVNCSGWCLELNSVSLVGTHGLREFSSLRLGNWKIKNKLLYLFYVKLNLLKKTPSTDKVQVSEL